MVPIIKLLKRNSKSSVFGVIILIVSFSIAGWVIINHAGHTSKELATVKANVSKLMLLPTNEEPTLAIVQDKTKLTDKFLLAKAQNGDQILVYTSNGFAVIYRPSINKIVAVTPVTVDVALAESSGATIKILNGTTDPYIVTKVQNEIKTAYPNAVLTTGVASRINYPTTVVINNSDTKDDLVKALIATVRGQLGVTPLGEATPTTDLVIIIGKDSLN